MAKLPKRLRGLERRYARVDGIPFELLVACRNSPVLMAAFKINADRARAESSRVRFTVSGEVSEPQ